MQSYKKIILYSAGSVAYACAQWLLLTFITRFYSIEYAGSYILFLAYITPLTILFNLGLRNSYATDIKAEYTDADYKTLRFFSLLTLFTTLLIFGWALGLLSIIFFVVVSVKIFDSMSELIYGSWLKEKRQQNYGFSQVLRLSLFLFIFSLFTHTGNGNVGLFSFSIAMLAVFFVFDLPKSAFYKEKIKFAINKQLLIKSLPLAISSTIIALNVSVPRVYWGHFFDEEVLAKFVFLTYFISLSAIPVSTLCQYFISTYSAGNKNKILLPLILLYGLLFYITIYLLGNWLVHFFYGVDMGYSSLQLSLTGVSGGCQYLIYYKNMKFTASRDFSSLMKVTIITLILTFIITPFGMEYYGELGGYVAFSLTSLSQLLIVSWFYKRLNNAK